MVADVRYATSGSASIAYSVEGEGRDVVFVGNWGTNMEALEGTVETRAWFSRLISQCRVTRYDQRSTGLSERGAGTHNMETWLEDLDAVVEAAAVKQPVLLAEDFAGPVALAYAASRPDSVAGLILIGTWARLFNDDHYDAGFPQHQRAAILQLILDGWAVAESPFNRLAVPEEARGRDRETVARIQRLAANRSEILATIPSLLDVDVSSMVEQVRAPTLLLHAPGDQVVPISLSRYLEAHLPNARLVELPGACHYPFFDDAQTALDETLRFLDAKSAGRVHGAKLAVVWFSDIVASTSHLEDDGDSRWSRRLDEHDDLVSYYVGAYGGELVKHLGDGVLALFDSASNAGQCALRFIPACERTGLQVRIGLHAGDVQRRIDGDVAGLAVHMAQRVQAEADPNEILVTTTVRELLAGSGMTFVERGERQLRGTTTVVGLHRVARD